MQERKPENWESAMCLEGSVRKAGSRRAADHTSSWWTRMSGAARVGRSAMTGRCKHVFAVQDDITRQIVAYLALRLTKEESERTWSQYLASYTGNPEAYDSYMHEPGSISIATAK